MGIVLSATFGLIVWIILWAMGIKAFDGIIFVIVLLLITMVGRMVIPLIPGLRND